MLINSRAAFFARPGHRIFPKQGKGSDFLLAQVKSDCSPYFDYSSRDEGRVRDLLPPRARGGRANAGDPAVSMISASLLLRKRKVPFRVVCFSHGAKSPEPPRARSARRKFPSADIAKICFKNGTKINFD